MEFKFVGKIIDGIEINLEILKRKVQRNSILMYQHEGNLSVSSEKIENKGDVFKIFLSFIELAKEKNVNLALSPEYSCPWSVIENIVANTTLQVSTGNLWVLGCESISISEIKNFKRKFDSNNVLVHFDEKIEKNAGSFLDPIVYLFQATVKGKNKLIVLIQFKTFPMGTWGGGDIERNNMICGNDIYVLNHKTSSVSLFTLICSEAMNLSEAMPHDVITDLGWEDNPYLILHPQFNPQPYHRHFRDFRKFVFSNKDKEIISLNWQLNSKFENNSLLPHLNSRSAIYINSNELNLNSERVNCNHRKGLYYFNNKKNNHSYIFSSVPHIYLIQNPPVKISGGVDSQRKRDGPEVVEVFHFQDGELVPIPIVDDFQIKYLNQITCQNIFLLNPENCVIDKERLVTLSRGNLDKKDKSSWWAVDKVDSIYMNSDHEINNRITVARNSSNESVKRRGEYGEAISVLQNILNNEESIPENINFLKTTKSVVGYIDSSKEDEYKFNVVTEEGDNMYATICYVGTVPYEIAKSVYVTIRKLFSGRASRDIERVAVFYNQGDGIKQIIPDSVDKINETNDYDDDSILK